MNAVDRVKPFPLIHFPLLDIEYQETLECLYYRMRPHPQPCFSTALLSDIEQLQNVLTVRQQSDDLKVSFLVLASQTAGIFSLGGDIQLLQRLIRNRDRQALQRYAKSAIDVIYRNMTNLDLSLVTISLLQGDAYGGGFEAALSSSVVIAERGVRLGFPEFRFNLFPGVAAYSLLARRVGIAVAQQIIASGRRYRAEELFEMGVIDVLADKQQGQQAVRDYIRRYRRVSNGLAAIRRVQDQIQPIRYQELITTAEIWVDTAMTLNERDLSTMQRLLQAQNRCDYTERSTLIRNEKHSFG